MHAEGEPAMHAQVTPQKRDRSPTELTTHYLAEQDVAYKVFEHEERFSSAAEARASGVAPHDAAKSLLLRDRDGYRLAVIPASERLDLKKLRNLLDANGDLRLATEQEMAADFPDFQIGALPPLGGMLKVPEAIDARLLDHRRVLCNAGDHRHSFLVDPRDLADLGEVRVGDICED
jgi:Ala-tRNA(Pro) deacylase